jgi:aspartyl-tRNA synthetase
MFNLKRTHKNNELRKEDIGKEVILNGWVNNIRPFGQITFIDIRDMYGITQIVFDSKKNENASITAQNIHKEYCIAIKGKVRKRIDGQERKEIETGEIEVIVDEIEILSKCEKLPLDSNNALEEARLKYRYLDLRTKNMQNNLILRSKIAIIAREYFNKNGFVEIETPLLVKSTPEGSRDYLVPSRVNLGKFYALPQSPQLYKQLLMISGFDKYYQFARCLRDEDLRADRQPEHTQMDLEMCFVDEKDIMNFVEGLYKKIITEIKEIEIKENFPIIEYKEAMDKYGSDKPDLRYGLELIDITDIMSNSSFNAFKTAIENGAVVKCIIAKKEFSRKESDELINYSKELGGKGLAFIYDNGDIYDKGISKFFEKNIQDKIREKTNSKKGDTIFFVCDEYKKCCNLLGNIRNKLALDLDLIPKDKNIFKFAWIVNFPLFSWNEEEKKWEPEHHMFSMPTKKTIDYLESDPGKVIGNLFDLTLNGVELGSGSIRINIPKIQKKIMNIVGINEEEAEKKFGFLLNAYRYGGPPHGGMGLGFDRTCALLLGYNDIREVIAFPKNKKAQSPMDDSPSNIDKEQLKEIHIDILEEK